LIFFNSWSNMWLHFFHYLFYMRLLLWVLSVFRTAGSLFLSGHKAGSVRPDVQTNRDCHPTPFDPYHPVGFVFTDKYSSDANRKDRLLAVCCVCVLIDWAWRQLSIALFLQVNKLWSWWRRLPKLHWKWVWSPWMAGFSTGGKQHQLSLCAQTVESSGRPVAKIQVPERVWPSHDALRGEISLVGIASGEWQVSVISFSGFIAQRTTYGISIL